MLNLDDISAIAMQIEQDGCVDGVLRDVEISYEIVPNFSTGSYEVREVNLEGVPVLKDDDTLVVRVTVNSEGAGKVKCDDRYRYADSDGYIDGYFDSAELFDTYSTKLLQLGLPID